MKNLFGHSFRAGFDFGLTSGIITTLGLIIGLNSATGSKYVILGGILTIAIADALSDAMGIHLSQESEKHTNKQVWISTISTFFSKFLFALTFLVPFLFFEIIPAILLSIVWGLLLISLLSYDIAKNNRKKPWKIILEHVLLTLTVIILANLSGRLIEYLFS